MKIHLKNTVKFCLFVS